MRVNKLWQNCNIRVDYPFNLEKFTKNMHTVTAGHTHSDTQICETTAVWSCKTEALLSVIRCCLWTNNSLTNRTQYQDHKLPWTSPNKDVTVSSLGLPKPHIVPPLSQTKSELVDHTTRKKRILAFALKETVHILLRIIFISRLFSHILLTLQLFSLYLLIDLFFLSLVGIGVIVLYQGKSSFVLETSSLM